MAVTERASPGIYRNPGRPGLIYSAQKPVVRTKPKQLAPTPTVPAPAPVQPMIPKAAPVPVADPATKEFYQKSLFGNLKSDGVTPSPMYEWRKNEAINALDRRFAANGQLGSGYADEQRMKAINQLTAEEDAKRETARSHEADRLGDMLEREATRRQDTDFRSRDDTFRTLEMLLGQYNPGDVPATVEQWAALERALGNAAGMGAGGGGGGGGGGAVAPQAPLPIFPSRPNTSTSSQAQILANAGNSAGYGQLASTLFNYLLQ